MIFERHASEMARTELEKKVKRQGKKRKHEVAKNPEHAASDDEVANKSLILAPQVDQQEVPTGVFQLKSISALCNMSNIYR